MRNFLSAKTWHSYTFSMWKSWKLFALTSSSDILIMQMLEAAKTSL